MGAHKCPHCSKMIWFQGGWFGTNKVFKNKQEYDKHIEYETREEKVDDWPHA